MADPSIADIQTPSNRVVFVFGKKPGRTSLFALSESGDPIAEYQIVVTPVEDLRELLYSEVPDSRIGVTYTPNGAVLPGPSRTPVPPKPLGRSPPNSSGRARS